jgi:hypothetical protein
MRTPPPPAPRQVCKREDSETYAKRTITEIETCLGFRFGGAAQEEETIDATEIQNLNSQVEAALAQGLSFKDKFRTSDRRRATASDHDDEEADGGDAAEGRGSGAPSSSDGDGAADERRAAPAAAAPAPQAAAGTRGGAAAAPAHGKKKLGGLKLAVGSQMDTGEWTSHGQFLKKDKGGTEIPNGLQQIKADDLVKVTLIILFGGPCGREGMV